MGELSGNICGVVRLDFSLGVCGVVKLDRVFFFFYLEVYLDGGTFLVEFLYLCSRIVDLTGHS